MKSKTKYQLALLTRLMISMDVESSVRNMGSVAHGAPWLSSIDRYTYKIIILFSFHHIEACVIQEIP